MKWGLAVVGTVALAACGGGGLGTAGGIAVPFQAANSTAAYAAPSAGGPSSASVAFTNGTGITGAGLAPADTAGNTVTLTTDSAGNLVTITITINTPNPVGGTGPGLSQRFAAANQGTATLTAAQFAALVAAIATSPITTANAVYQGAVAGLKTSAYGAWMQSNGGGSYNVGVYAFGPETPAMPTTGTASYNGTTLGYGSNGAAPFTFAGNAQMTANFATNAITNLQFSNLATHDVNDGAAGPTLSTISGNGPIAGNTYTFAVAGTATPIGGAATAVTGAVNGQFFGVGAAETGGTWKAANIGNTVTLIGAFGAHQ
jgi:hypothetical protein